MSSKVKKPGTHIWKLILFILFAFSTVDSAVVALATKDPGMVGGIVGAAVLTVLFGFLWWRTRPVDRVLRAKAPEQKLALLEKITDPKQLLEIAKMTDSPVQEAALARIADPNVLLDAARNFDEFAIRHLPDPELLFRVATEQGFFRKPKGSEAVGYQRRMDEARDLAVNSISDTDTLLRLAKAEGTVAWTALKKLLKDRPELARSLVGDWKLPQPKRDYAVKFLTEQAEQQLDGRPEAAMDLFRDRTLPLKTRLAVLAHVSGQEELFSLYDTDDDKDARKAVVEGIRDQAMLIQIADQEPDKGIRLIAENRVTDPEKHRLYCQRDGAHLWIEKDSRWENHGDWHYEYITYRCPYCGLQREEEGESRRD